jgi:hypothetical protein
MRRASQAIRLPIIGGLIFVFWYTVNSFFPVFDNFRQHADGVKSGLKSGSGVKVDMEQVRVLRKSAEIVDDVFPIE